MNENQIRNIMRQFPEVPSCWHKAYCELVINERIIDRRFGRLIRNDEHFKACWEMSLLTRIRG